MCIKLRRAAGTSLTRPVSLLVDHLQAAGDPYILLHHTFKRFIASSNPSQLVNPAHLIFYIEECFMHGLFMLENMVPLFFISDIVCSFFKIQGYSVGVLSHPPHDL